ncbi:hypothetical protein HPB52_002351 [Rhipicephalus sanguineus]|uniref:Endonuclease/exonuclease/phosphatase domain-containing protein n=1 Tax=Rhipicephalus sanguineus TaxID=34632 RepID=A0A9D4QAC7_RHISA|nr:hypothetical protein HPB52_002351 [Rhipicephalus sanguineus]
MESEYETTTRQVATQLAQVIPPFLGPQRPRRSRDNPTRTPRRKSDPNVSSPALETLAVPPPPQPPGMAAVTQNTPHREFRDNIQDLPHLMYLMNTAHLPTQSTQPCPPRASPAPQTWISHEGTTHPAMRWGSNREVLIMGDFNGHVQSTDGFQDHNGALMLQLAETFSLEVANLRPDCIGETTWSARNRSCIDYILTSPDLAAHLTRVHVDESGRYSLGSDHNRIALTFSTSVHRNRRTQSRKPARRYLPVTSFELVAEDFEENDIHAHQTTYEEFVGELCVAMRSESNPEVAPDQRPGGTSSEAPIPTIRDATGHAVADLEEHLTIHMQRMYDNPSPEQQGVSYQPREKVCEMENGTTAECEWKVSRVAIDRAILWVATGLRFQPPAPVPVGERVSSSHAVFAFRTPLPSRASSDVSA